MTSPKKKAAGTNPLHKAMGHPPPQSPTSRKRGEKWGTQTRKRGIGRLRSGRLVAKNAKGRGTQFVGDASKIKAWATSSIRPLLRLGSTVENTSFTHDALAKQ
jgi:hypothetical protein